MKAPDSVLEALIAELKDNGKTPETKGVVRAFIVCADYGNGYVNQNVASTDVKLLEKLLNACKERNDLKRLKIELYTSKSQRTPPKQSIVLLDKEEPPTPVGLLAPQPVQQFNAAELEERINLRNQVERLKERLKDQEDKYNEQKILLDLANDEINEKDERLANYEQYLANLRNENEKPEKDIDFYLNKIEKFLPLAGKLLATSDEPGLKRLGTMAKALGSPESKKRPSSKVEECVSYLETFDTFKLGLILAFLEALSDDPQRFDIIYHLLQNNFSGDVETDEDEEEMDMNELAEKMQQENPELMNAFQRMIENIETKDIVLLSHIAASEPDAMDLVWQMYGDKYGNS